MQWQAVVDCGITCLVLGQFWFNIQSLYKRVEASLHDDDDDDAA